MHCSPSALSTLLYSSCSPFLLAVNHAAVWSHWCWTVLDLIYSSYRLCFVYLAEWFLLLKYLYHLCINLILRDLKKKYPSLFLPASGWPLDLEWDILSVSGRQLRFCCVSFGQLKVKLLVARCRVRGAAVKRIVHLEFTSPVTKRETIDSDRINHPDCAVLILWPHCQGYVHNKLGFNKDGSQVNWQTWTCFKWFVCWGFEWEKRS